MESTTVLFVILGCLSVTDAAMVCYFGSWAAWRPGLGRFDVEDIDPFLCTHIVYAFAGISPDTWKIKVLGPYNELCDSSSSSSSNNNNNNNDNNNSSSSLHQCAFARFVALRDVNPRLKVLLAVGGWAQGSVTFSAMARDPAKRRAFIDSTVAMLNDHGFDGCDIDWEYPGSTDGTPKDEITFIHLLSELREALDMEGMMLTAAVSASIGIIERAYDVPAMSNLLDMISIMAYDMHGAWETFTHHNAPLYAHPKDTGANLRLNIDRAIKYWIDHGADRSKMILGIPAYGRCYTLDSLRDTGFFASASTPGHQGPYTRTNGTLGYNEICQLMQESGGWVIVNDPAMHEPYAYCPENKIWCGYDDVDSVYLKAQYAKDMGLGGTMVWSLETDDFHGLCTGHKFGLVKSMVEGFGRSPVSSTTPLSTASPSPVITGTPPACSVGQSYITDIHCDKYWYCIKGLPIRATCPPGLVWDNETFSCRWPSDDTYTSNCIMPWETDPPLVVGQPSTNPPPPPPPLTVAPAETMQVNRPGAPPPLTVLQQLFRRVRSQEHKVAFFPRTAPSSGNGSSGRPLYRSLHQDGCGTQK